MESDRWFSLNSSIAVNSRLGRAQIMVDVSVDASLPHPEQDPFVGWNTSGFPSPTEGKSPVVEILTNLNGFCPPRPQVATAASQVPSDPLARSIMNSSEAGCFTSSVSSGPFPEGLGFSEATIKSEGLTPNELSVSQGDPSLLEVGLIANCETESDFFSWDPIESVGHYHSDQVQRWITEDLKRSKTDLDQGVSSTGNQEGIFWIRPDQPLRIDGKDGFEIIDLSCFNVSQATFQPNQITIAQDSQTRYKIEYAQVQTALFAEGEIVDLRPWDCSLINGV